MERNALQGSHRHSIVPIEASLVTVPGNGGKELAPGIGFSAYSPDVPGCASAGDTEEETRSNFREALAAHFEAMRDWRIDSRA